MILVAVSANATPPPLLNKTYFQLLQEQISVCIDNLIYWLLFCEFVSWLCCHSNILTKICLSWSRRKFDGLMKKDRNISRHWQVEFLKRAQRAPLRLHCRCVEKQFVLNDSLQAYDLQIVSHVSTSRADVPWTVIPPGAKAELLESVLIDPPESIWPIIFAPREQLKITNPMMFVWPPKVYKTVQLDEIYRVMPYLEGSPRSYMRSIGLTVMQDRGICA